MTQAETNQNTIGGLERQSGITFDCILVLDSGYCKFSPSLSSFFLVLLSIISVSVILSANYLLSACCLSSFIFTVFFKLLPHLIFTVTLW